ncbi:McrC family protein [Neobacillus sp. BF23-41]|uniref:McrC family protein n=1 Tax=Neobacillus sp. BF23-41 TaxID=3240280 RepID=UPI0034E54B7A
MYRIIKVAEYERIFIRDYFSEEKKFITQEQASLLRKNEKKLGKKVFEWSYDFLTPINWVGVFIIPGLQVEIFPKLDSDEDADKLRDELLFMLSYTRRVPYRITNEGEFKKSKDSLLEIYIKVFIRKVNEIIKQGLFNGYNLKTANENFQKGKLLIQKQITFNQLRKEKFYVAYEELTENNLLNMIVKATIDLLFTRTMSLKNKSDLIILRNILSSIDTRKFNKNLIKRVKYNRLNKYYKEVIDLSKLFWNYDAPSLNSGNNISTIGLLFDMNKVFESFIIQSLLIFSEKLTEKSYEVQRQIKSKYLFQDNKNKNLFKLKPDIILKNVHTDSPELIIDTKWKLLDTRKENLGISQSDIYQMYAYAREYNVNNLVLLYPFHKDLNVELPIFTNESMREMITLKVKTIDLYSVSNNFNDVYKQQLFNIISN